jgi:glycosyltransferase involved in cell wall biosynthesis
MKIIFLTQITPYPPSGGEKIRSFGLLKALSSLGHEVLAVTPSDITGPEAELALPGITFRSCRFHTPSGLIGQFAGYFTKDRYLLRCLAGIMNDFKPDLAFIDYFFLGQYIRFFQSHGIPVIYGTHNAQSELRRQQPAPTTGQMLVRWFSWRAQSWHEKFYFPKADALICVSSDDFLFHKEFMARRKMHIIPNFIDERLYLPSPKKEDYIIMTGNFNSFQNFHGMQWFLNEVWNDEIGAITRLVLLGSGAPEALDRIREGRSLPGIQALESAADFTGMISRARIALVPLWHGSGTRLKCIEAMALKTQIVSTTKGAEGIAHDGGIVIADTPAEFRDSIRECISGGLDTTTPAFEAFRRDYSLDANAIKLGKLIRSLVNEPKP